MKNRDDIRAEDILGGIRSWVEIETPTTEPACVNQLMDKVEADYRRLDVRIERIAGRDGMGDHLKVRAPWGGDGPGILLMSHLDTVWPLGTLAERPVRIDGDKAFGPGINDMKGGAYLTFHAVSYLIRHGIKPRLPLTILYTADEEVGSPTSRELIETEAGNTRYVLVPEPGKLRGGAVVTRRPGWGQFHMSIFGRAAHAGDDHKAGRSAIAELARQVVRLEEMTDYEAEISVNVGVIKGGTRINVVPAEARAEIDLRVPTAEVGARMRRRILDLQPIDRKVRLEVTGGINRPPFERTAEGARLYERARRIAAAHGFELPEMPSGGVSDGNFTAAMGIATLDGLGVVGAGSHAVHEHILIPHLVRRALLMIGLIETLD